MEIYCPAVNPIKLIIAICGQWNTAKCPNSGFYEGVDYTIVVECVKNLAQNTAYSMFERNTCKYEKFQLIGPKKNNLDPVKFCPEYVVNLSELRVLIK